MPAERHPLEPLSPEEYRRIAEIVRSEKDLDERARFTSILLREPSKADIRDHAGGIPTAREATVVVLDRTGGNTYTGRVSLTEGSVVEWSHRVGEQANMTAEELEECDEAMRNDPRVVEALAKRGITDLDLVAIEVWAYPGNLVPEQYQGMRIGWTDVWQRSNPKGNVYANPVSGLQFIVDLNRMELLEVQDRYSIGAGDHMGEYAPDQVPGLVQRTDIKPLDIVQPEGPSFRLSGNLLQWQNWSMRIGFNSREGLTLHTLTYKDGDDVRSIAHRMSFAEMVVPYRDPSPDHYRRTAFDIGEWGLGFMTTSLELGCDCLGEIRYLDGVIHDWMGEPVTIKNAICLHEEDDAVLWKHVDPTTGTEVRRSRRMVVSFHATVANYEYLVYWRFYTDGNIECEVRATGIMVTTGFPSGNPPATGTVVDIDTHAPYHQHFIITRLDLDIDGSDNTVYEVDSYAPDIGPDNEYGISLRTRSTPLTVEGGRDLNWHTQRTWKIVNENLLNRMGTNTSYKLIPEAAFPAIMNENSPILARAGAIAHNVWVTPTDERELWPCGELVVQSTSDQGLPSWVQQQRSVENTDVTLWYVFGIHHITRPEEWPIMPVDKVAFWLKPMGFFDRNPSLDVPPPPESDHCHT